ncbi:hypothetical protein [Candidatus Uabimicrobium sp. HlEnr_7]|uniref:hypothetical protein n=1 Tax=Candidatus Uabimicrobium helgolandensis TaxID=3095367 RepID=UPI003558170F
MTKPKYKNAKSARKKIPFRYPSIKTEAQKYVGEQCVAFQKYDGSNLWFKWTQEKGWQHFGTRKFYITADHKLFGPAYKIFLEKYADGILSVCRRYKEYRNTKEVIAFCEYYGANSFSGIHQPLDKKELKLFDVYLTGIDFVSPHNFLHHFGKLDTAEVVFQGTLSLEFIVDVYNDKYNVNEGVVIKGNKLKRRRKGVNEFEVWMAKVKTQSYLQELNDICGENPDLKKEYEEMVHLHRNLSSNS